jgi:hypothetical protein
MVMLVSKLGQGLGDLLYQPTLYVIKKFGATALEVFAKGFLVPTNGDNSELYVKALAELDDDVLLSSCVLSTRRERDSVKVLVKTPTGQKIIETKTLLVTVPPKLDNLQGFDLDARETSLFVQFSNSAYYTSYFGTQAFSTITASLMWQWTREKTFQICQAFTRSSQLGSRT